MLQRSESLRTKRKKPAFHDSVRYTIQLSRGRMGREGLKVVSSKCGKNISRILY